MNFKENRMCVDPIFILGEVIKQSINYNKLLFFCWEALNRAFVRMMLSVVITILQQLGTGSHYIQLIKEHNKNDIMKTKTNNQFSKGRQQANKSPRISGYLRDLVWRNKCITGLTYAVETPAETSNRKVLEGLCR